MTDKIINFLKRNKDINVTVLESLLRQEGIIADEGEEITVDEEEEENLLKNNIEQNTSLL